MNKRDKERGVPQGEDDGARSLGEEGTGMERLRMTKCAKKGCREE